MWPTSFVGSGQIWNTMYSSGHLKKDIVELEEIQNRAANLLGDWHILMRKDYNIWDFLVLQKCLNEKQLRNSYAQ